MQNRILIVLWFAVVLGGCAGSQQRGPMSLRSDDPAFSEVGFMSGSWSTQASRSGTRVEEHWTPASGGSMLGISRTIREGETVFYEYMRIERTAEGLVYIASPGGRAQTRFRMVESGRGRVVFENREHDFPQRIMYRRTHDGLHARIEGLQRGQERREEWYYREARVDR